MKYYLAIDPGATGSMCALSHDGNIIFKDFKENSLRGYISWLKDVIATHGNPAMIVVERVASMHGQGVKSVFSFGQRLGEIEGMLQTLELGYEFVRPQLWQKECGVRPKSGKKGIYETISKIYPSAELLGARGGVIDGRCDALSMAHYCRKVYQ